VEPTGYTAGPVWKNSFSERDVIIALYQFRLSFLSMIHNPGSQWVRDFLPFLLHVLRGHGRHHHMGITWTAPR